MDDDWFGTVRRYRMCNLRTHAHLYALRNLQICELESTLTNFIALEPTTLANEIGCWHVMYCGFLFIDLPQDLLLKYASARYLDLSLIERLIWHRIVH